MDLKLTGHLTLRYAYKLSEFDDKFDVVLMDEKVLDNRLIIILIIKIKRINTAIKAMALAEDETDKTSVGLGKYSTIHAEAGEAMVIISCTIILSYMWLVPIFG
jgi:hypothetical protein